MHWYSYLACFFAGMFLVNVVPHLVHGVSGDPFPTPFAKPPGKGLSSAPVNMVWALANMVIGYLLFCAGHVGSGASAAVGVFFAGVAVLGVWMSVEFQKKHAS
jgi:hypothetical protein